MWPRCSASVFHREARNGTYVMHFANSDDEALHLLDESIEPDLLAILSDINIPEWTGCNFSGRSSNASPTYR